METLFWASILIVVYVYAGYPLLLAIWSGIVSRPVAKTAPSSRANDFGCHCRSE